VRDAAGCVYGFCRRSWRASLELCMEQFNEDRRTVAKLRV